MPSLRSLCLVLAFSASAAATSLAAPIVNNGNFQTGTLSGWTVTGTNFPWTAEHLGTNSYASTGCEGQACITGSTPSSLSQTLATLAGHTYTLTFDFAADDAPSELKVLFGSTVAADLVNASETINTYTLAGLVAGGNTTQLNFLGRQDPGFNYLDNITVVDNGSSNSPVPEPGTVGMVGTGILGLLGAARRRLSA